MNALVKELKQIQELAQHKHLSTTQNYVSSAAAVAMDGIVKRVYDGIKQENPGM